MKLPRPPMEEELQLDDVQRMMKPEVSYEGKVAILTMNRPETLNALSGTSSAMRGQPRNTYYDTYWRELFQDLKHNPKVRVVVIASAVDKAWSSGMDMKAGGRVPDTRTEVEKLKLDMTDGTLIREGNATPNRFIRELQKPSIAMVNGWAIGMAADFALACDMRIASDGACFWWAYILRGIAAQDGACWLLPRLVGTAKAMELLLTGRQVYAEEALRLGIVNMVVPHEQLKEKTMELAHQIANGPWACVQAVRHMIYAGETSSFWDSLGLSYLVNHITKEEGVEGAAAFTEKRQPSWP